MRLRQEKGRKTGKRCILLFPSGSKWFTSSVLGKLKTGLLNQPIPSDIKQGGQGTAAGDFNSSPLQFQFWRRGSQWTPWLLFKQKQMHFSIYPQNKSGKEEKKRNMRQSIYNIRKKLKSLHETKLYCKGLYLFFYNTKEYIHILLNLWQTVFSFQ